MRRFEAKERFSSRAARESGVADPLLSIEEQLDSVILELTRPIEVTGEEVTEITIKAPEPDDVLDFENRDRDSKQSQYLALTKVTGIPPDGLKKLHFRDFNRLRDLYWAFGV